MIMDMTLERLREKDYAISKSALPVMITRLVLLCFVCGSLVGDFESTSSL
jgi:hypothetical protein